jgi:hypothetical protein
MSFEEIAALADQLSPLDKVRLIKHLANRLEHQLTEQKSRSRRSALGIAADLVPAPSAEDIDEVRKEVWKNFPREDI